MIFLIAGDKYASFKLGENYPPLSKELLTYIS